MSCHRDKVYLSICLITYNHVKYIREALNGIFSQEFNFNWELVIADDFSTDGTREILLEYKSKYPETINLILQPQNIGPARNWTMMMHAPRGEFIALCDGDDFWSDPLKIQKQVSFLEKNLDYVIVTHNTNIINFDNFNDRFELSDESCEISLENWINGCPAQTSTYLFRRPQPDSIPAWLWTAPIGDVALVFFLMYPNKKCYWFNEKMSSYRIHSEGLSLNFSSNNFKKNIDVKLRILNTTKILEEYSYPNFKNVFKVRKILLLKEIALYHWYNGDGAKCLKFLRLAFILNPFLTNFNDLKLLKNGLKTILKKVVS